MLAAMASGSRRHDQPLHQLPHATEAVAQVVDEVALPPSRLLQPAVLPDKAAERCLHTGTHLRLRLYYHHRRRL